MNSSKEQNQLNLQYNVADVEYECTKVVTYKPTSIENKLPALPLSLYQQITSWLSDVSKKHNSEGVCSLTVVDNVWKVIVWHQEVPSSLHVDFDESSDDNQLLLDDATREALQKVHCTIHSHNKAAAGQSSNDQEDECSKPGWHITVGNCDKKKYSTHARFNITKDAVYGDDDDNYGQKISDSWQEFIPVNLSTIIESLPDHDLNPSYVLSMDAIAKMNTKAEYPSEWLDRITKPTYHHSSNKYGMWNNAGQHTSYNYKKKNW